MGTKEKRKEKPEHKVSQRFKIIASLMVLSLSIGVISVASYFFTDESVSGWPTSTHNALRTQNTINLTLISATETAAARWSTAERFYASPTPKP